MTELAEAKVAKSDEEALEAQKTRVRGMSNEEFASYKADLVEIRKSVEDQVRAELEAASNKNKSEDGLDVAPADLDAASRENAAALPDVEGSGVDDISAKYQSFGNAMAKAMRKDDR